MSLKSICLFDHQGGLRTLADLQEEIIRHAIDYCNGSASEAARMLEIGRTTLYRRGHKSYRRGHLSVGRKDEAS